MRGQSRRPRAGRSGPAAAAARGGCWNRSATRSHRPRRSTGCSSAAPPVATTTASRRSCDRECDRERRPVAARHHRPPPALVRAHRPAARSLDLPGGRAGAVPDDLVLVRFSTGRDTRRRCPGRALPPASGTALGPLHRRVLGGLHRRPGAARVPRADRRRAWPSPNLNISPRSTVSSDGSHRTFGGYAASVDRALKGGSNHMFQRLRMSIACAAASAWCSLCSRPPAAGATTAVTQSESSSRPSSNSPPGSCPRASPSACCPWRTSARGPTATSTGSTSSLARAGSSARDRAPRRSA